MVLYSGFCLFIHACAQASHGASRHMGSLPGVSGLSGMHVHALVPFRSIVPSQSLTVAPLAIDAGAALMALAILSGCLA